ncbi:MAG: HNH endonuclease [Candidatus Dormibacteraeota bacterium]|nr:HNH endonuclease [Candidatus Dormibacteraeota bacterium]
MLATQDVCPSSTAHLTNDERRERLIRKAHAIHAQQLSFAQEAAEFAATDAWDEDGFASAIDWIRINCQMTSGAAANSIAVGEAMNRLPESTQATFEGGIGYAHLTVMARTAEALDDRFDEAVLLEKAKENSPGKFHYVCQHYRHAADPKRYAAEQAEQVENRRLKLSTWMDGSLLISGILDPVGGAVVRNALEPLARKSGAHDDRTLERRQADAFVELAARGEHKAQIQVTSSLETLLGLAGSPAAEMEFSSVPISSKTVGRLACDNSLTRILVNSESVVIDVGRSKRVVSGPSKRALHSRDHHCRWPGCDRPASRSAAHHVVHWIHGGTSDLGNLILLCHRHHWMVHEGNWQLVRGDDGRMLTIPPTVTFGPPARGPD